MDPLAALSLAGNIIQFVDFGGRLLGGAGEIYRSADGSLKVHDELELVATDLREQVAGCGVQCLEMTRQMSKTSVPMRRLILSS